ncbi:DsbA family protein [Oceaniglobus ichthyenteri]|uniref:DsbA family protein n=1 Tax=Oceaniglobus ichthyenteri TaxID=2136177 RepID=UPI000D3A51F8|nr:DsbA family protein [Oceaniglobus ichthyenteri]
MKRFIPAIIAIALGLGGAVYYLNQPTDTTAATSFALDAQEAGDVDLSLVNEMTMGDADAPVTMVEYSSFTCPHCKRYHEGPMKEIKKNYIDTGKVHYIAREVYFDRYGLWAGMVARCGGPVRYFGVTDLIYAQQAEWTRGEPAEIVANLRRIGKTAGLSDTQLDACLADADKAQAMVATWEKFQAEDQIQSTPTFMVNGTQYSNMSYDEFATLLDEKLGE